MHSDGSIYGGYSYLKSVEEAEQQKKGETYSEEQINTSLQELSEVEQQQIEEAVEIEQKIIELNDYKNNSILMQMNPYAEDAVVLQYYVNTLAYDANDLVALYVDYINNQGIVSRYIEEGLDEQNAFFFGELVSANAIQNSHLGLNEDLSNSQFNITVVGADSEQAEKVANEEKGFVDEYKDKLNSQVASHELDMINYAKGKTADESLADQQLNVNSKIVTLNQKYEALIANFSKKQLAVYQGDVEQENVETATLSTEVVKPTISIKYIFMGIIAGIILGVLGSTMSYSMSSKIYKIEVMRELYCTNVYAMSFR